MLPSVTMLAGVWYVQVWLRLRRAVLRFSEFDTENIAKRRREDWVPITTSHLRALGQRGLHALRSKGNLADASACGVEDRVTNSGRNNGDGCLAGPGRFFVGAVDQLNFDLRDVEPKRQGVVGSPVDRSHLLVVPGDLFP